MSQRCRVAQFTSIRYGERLAEIGAVPSGYLNDIPPAEFEETFYATKRADQLLVGIQ